MASEADKKELVSKLTRHVGARFGGTGSKAWRRAFVEYDRDADARIDAAELGALLEAAGVGNFMTIGAWTQGVLAELDKDRSSGISYPELERVLVAAPAATSPVFAQATEAVARPDYLFPLERTLAPRPKPRPKPLTVPSAPSAQRISEGVAIGLIIALALLLFQGRR